MVDSKDKGTRAENIVKDILKQKTKLAWERVPGSGALDEKHKLKGDLYIPDKINLYCVEVKHYKDCYIDHSLICGKNPQLIEWWKQTLRQAAQVNKKPLLIFKHDRSKLFVAFLELPNNNYPYICVNKDDYEFNIAMLEDFLEHEQPKFIV